MTVLVIGVLLWWAAHLWKRVAPESRGRMGDPGKGLVAGLLVLSVILMVWGYRGALADPVYQPLAGMGHLNNLLMLIAFCLLGAGHTKGVIGNRLRHPMLLAVIIWSVAHLLVNGDSASLILFGGLGLWAVVEIVLLNRLTEWSAKPGGSYLGDLKAVAGGVVLFAIVAGIHVWLGHNPFLGSYA